MTPEDMAERDGAYVECDGCNNEGNPEEDSVYCPNCYSSNLADGLVFFDGKLIIVGNCLNCGYMTRPEEPSLAN